MNRSKKRFKEARIKLEGMINKLGCLQDNWEEHHELISELMWLIDRLKEREEKYWKHRAKIKWL